MAGFKNLAINNLKKTASLIPIEFLIKRSNQNLILPFYHTVANTELVHIKNLYKVKSEAQFIKDLDFLLKHFEPIDYKDFKNNSSFSKPSFLLSFDDGLKEFDDVIAPILIKKGIPAICFLNSAFIDNNDLFFRYKASLLIEEFNCKPDLKQKFYSLGINDIQKHLLGISYKNKEKLDTIANLINYSFEQFLEKEKPYLTSKQIENLIKKGFYFGSHSVDHPEYQFINEAEQILQTKKSIDFIVNRFNLDYKIFSFPFTDYNISKNFFDKIEAMKLLETTFGTAGQKKDEIKTNVQRIAFENKNLSAEEIIKTELLYFLLKNPFGKNIIRRK